MISISPLLISSSYKYHWLFCLHVQDSQRDDGRDRLWLRRHGVSRRMETWRPHKHSTPCSPRFRTGRSSMFHFLACTHVLALNTFSSIFQSVKDDGSHFWRMKQFARPTYCNKCFGMLVSFGTQGLSCVCKWDSLMSTAYGGLGGL